MTTCDRCGANLDLVGRAHRCVTHSPAVTHSVTHTAAPVTHTVTHRSAPKSNAERQAEYRRRHGDEWRKAHRERMARSRSRRKVSDAERH